MVTSCPSEFLAVEIAPEDTVAGTKAIVESVCNPKYGQWIVNDNLLRGWLYGSMTPEVAREVIGCTTSADLWQALGILYGAHSKAKVDETRTLIQTTWKDGLSMVEYLRKMRSWADVLAIVGSPYSDTLLVASVLSGLDAEYMPIIVSLETNPSTTWPQLQDRLLSYDSKLERMHMLSTGVNKSSSNISANVAATSSSTVHVPPPPGTRFATRADIRRFRGC
jgi:hypothetical protein